ncbi:hypothetical protein C8R45DRAFT_1101541 [Mycena sanguinolenta]|nr:hypothetical protein C8R45DRAFT_1101541 [Mycena sanguinolenta]
MATIYVADRTCDADVWVEYNVDLADPVRKLKTDIYETEGVPIGRQCLKYEGIELRDEQVLQSSDLQDSDIVERGQNLIIVELRDGERIQCHVDLDGRLSDLKETLLEKCSLRDHSPWLKCKKRVLAWDDERTLSSLGLHNDDLVTLLKEGTRVRVGPDGLKELSERDYRQVPSPSAVQH